MDPTADGSPPNSMYMVRCGEMFPKPAIEKEDEKLQVPFNELPGEGVKYIGETTDGILALTNYRIFVLRRQQEKSVPLGLIDTVQSRDLFHLIVYCKDANTVKCSFETTEKCSEWQRRITVSVSSLVNLNSLFAFPFYAWSSEQSELLQQQQQQRGMSSSAAGSRSSSPPQNMANGSHESNGALATIVTEAEWSGRLRKISSQDYDEEFRKEVQRLQFNLRGAWRISKVNEDFKLCPSYPRHFLVPTYITDETLQSVANFRSSRRIPVAVWRHRITGAIIARCSQPEVGWLGWRNNKDEELLQAFVNACAFDQGEQQQQNGNQLMSTGDGNSLVAAEWSKGESVRAISEVDALSGGCGNVQLNSASDAESVASSSPEGSHEEVRMDKPKKMLIVDARSYASAVTNRARGGGCECIDYYPSAEIQFMNLANIHAVRKSFNAMRQLCASPPDMGSWLSNLEKTMWLQHLSGLLAASVTVSRTIDVEGRPVLVHCSDGWDRTPQIVATAQLCLDPYYRTVNGFKTLVEREWLSFGHKFGDRCGHGPNSYELNERCPVFLQWLDCVHQIHNQFPCSFEFSIGYLIKLAQHSQSCLFGTFLGNTMRERIDNSIFDRTYSVWPFLSGPMYKNPLYVPNRATVLWPEYNIRDLTLWKEVYLGNLHMNQSSATAMNAEMLGAKMETMLERMESVEGDDKLDMVIGALNLEVEDDQIETLKHGGGEPVSPMSKTRSYGDLLEANGNSAGPQRRCSDPTVPIDLIKQQPNGLPHLNGGVLKDINSCDSEREETTQMPNKSAAATELEEEMKRNTIDDDVANNCPANEREDLTGPEMKTLNQIVDEIGEEHKRDTMHFLANGMEVSSTLNVIPDGVLDVQITENGRDSVDGSPSPPHGNSVNMDVMLESVDLRVSTDKQHPDNGDNLKCSMWHGNVETSTDTLVPTNALTEEESKHFPGSFNCELPNFLTKREENEESRMQRIDGIADVGNRIQNGIDCSVYGESSFDMALLNNQSLYVSTPNAIVTTGSSAVDSPRNDNLLDMSLIESVIQTQPLSAKRHRRTPSNSKSEPSPHKFQNGNMSPSTMNSRFSTPGGRSPNLTPPSGPVVFEKANNVILSCPDGLAHALSEQNIRLQQIIYEHKLREEALQRELNATRLALLKRTCYQCNNNQAPSSNHDEQNPSMDAGENMSVCSWEAVEERSGTSSTSAQSDQMTAPINSKVLWVPDHAVNKCTGCSFEFWIGRRKHHCRSCGKIFCSDCSEFFAPLPDERLYQPVRLCGPCYLSVTTKLQSQHDQHQQQQQQQQEYQNQPLSHNQVNSNFSSIVNHNYSHHRQQFQPITSSVADYKPSAEAMRAEVEDPPKLVTNGDRASISPSTIAAAATTILRNNSSCSLEAGGEQRNSAEGSNGLMSVSDVVPSRISNGSNTLDGHCNLKTATASN